MGLLCGEKAKIKDPESGIERASSAPLVLVAQ